MLSILTHTMVRMTTARILTGQTFSSGLTTQRELKLYILCLDMGHCQKQY